MRRANKCINKRAYSTRGQVLTAARNSYLKRQVKTNYYECAVCLDFHLTSSPKNGFLPDKYFKRWDRQWMQKAYEDYLAVEGQVLVKFGLQEKKVKRAQQKANRVAKQAARVPQQVVVKKMSKKQLNTLPLAQQKAIFATFDSKVYPQHKSVLCRLLGIIKGVGSSGHP